MRHVSVWSPWLKRRYPKLSGSISADVAIVGGGITGASAAYHLRDSGLKVVLLEAGTLGSGATSKNVGALVRGTEHDFSEAIGKFGRKKALGIWKSTDAALEELEAAVKNGRINCGFTRHGLVVVAQDKKQLAMAKSEIKALRGAGFRAKWLEPEEIGVYVNEPFLGGVKTEDVRGCNPVQLVQGLVQKSGTRIFERSPVKVALGEGSWLARAAGGKIGAEKLVMATESFTRLDGIRMRHEKITCMSTTPISRKLLSMIWPGSQIVWNFGTHYHTFRKMPDGRVLFHATEGAQKGLHHYFPQLKAHVESVWSGTIAGFSDHVPRIGEIPGKPGLYAGLGYWGHGMVFGWLAGKLLANEIMGRKSRWQKLYRPA
jgi:glycine/D-amino acid oxidase-like deaminating enzyme